MVEVQMISPLTLRPRIETVSSGRDCSHSDDGPLEDDEAMQAGFEVKQSRSSEPNTNNTITATNNTNNKTNTNNRANSNNTDTVTSSSNVSGEGEGETVTNLYVSVPHCVWSLQEDTFSLQPAQQPGELQGRLHRGPLLRRRAPPQPGARPQHEADGRTSPGQISEGQGGILSREGRRSVGEIFSSQILNVGCSRFHSVDVRAQYGPPVPAGHLQHHQRQPGAV